MVLREQGRAARGGLRGPGQVQHAGGGGGGTGTADESGTGADVGKNLSVAMKWVTGDLASYGNAPVTYSGAPITFKTTHHVPKVSGLAKAQIKGYKILEKMSGGKIKVKRYKPATARI